MKMIDAQTSTANNFKNILLTCSAVVLFPMKRDWMDATSVAEKKVGNP